MSSKTNISETFATSKGTSFRIEDILYRPKSDSELQKTFQDTSSVYNIHSTLNNIKQPTNSVQSDISGSIASAKYHPHQHSSQNIKRHETNKNNNLAVNSNNVSAGYSYLQNSIPSGGLTGNANCASGFQPSDNGYIQVAVGALGAYFGSPYKTISDPYFLTQGK